MEINDFSKKLRKNMTDAERLLWRRLRDYQIKGFKFRRQEPIGKYVADFVCFEKKIIVELDGSQHMDNLKDKIRDEWLQSQGFRVLRFWDNEVLQNTDGVLQVIFDSV